MEMNGEIFKNLLSGALLLLDTKKYVGDVKFSINDTQTIAEHERLKGKKGTKAICEYNYLN